MRRHRVPKRVNVRFGAIPREVMRVIVVLVVHGLLREGGAFQRHRLNLSAPGA